MPHACYYGVGNDDNPNPPAATLEQLQRENELLRASLQASSQQADLLRAERVELLKQLEQKDRELDDVQHQLQALLRRYFGRSSEKMDPRQRLLFENLVDKAIPEMAGAPEADAEASPESPSRRRGRRPTATAGGACHPVCRGKE
jgi:hypothetical protein